MCWAAGSKLLLLEFALLHANWPHIIDILFKLLHDGIVLVDSCVDWLCLLRAVDVCVWNDLEMFCKVLVGE